MLNTTENAKIALMHALETCGLRGESKHLGTTPMHSSIAELASHLGYLIINKNSLTFFQRRFSQTYIASLDCIRLIFLHKYIVH